MERGWQKKLVNKSCVLCFATKFMDFNCFEREKEVWVLNAILVSRYKSTQNKWKKIETVFNAFMVICEKLRITWFMATEKCDNLTFSTLPGRVLHVKCLLKINYNHFYDAWFYLPSLTVPSFFFSFFTVKCKELKLTRLLRCCHPFEMYIVMNWKLGHSKGCWMRKVILPELPLFTYY